MAPEETYMQWDWTTPATLLPGEKARQLNFDTPALARHRRMESGPAFQQIGTNTYRYWNDGRTRAEQLVYLRSKQVSAA